MKVSASPRASSPRTAIALGLAILVGSAAIHLAVSRVTGPSFDELGRIGANDRARELVRAFSDFGPSASVSSSARTIYDELAPFGVLPALISGSLGDAWAHIGLVDKLTGIRLGWLFVTLLAPVALFSIVEASRGPRVGALAAAVLLATPRWTHAAALGSEPAVVVSLWLLLVAAYVRSLPARITLRRRETGRHRRSNAALFAPLLGVALAIDPATLWVLPLVLIHYFVFRGRETLRLLRRGTAPLPSAGLWVLAVTPVVVLLLTPKLWRGGAVSAAEWLLLPLAPTIESVPYKGVPVSLEKIPPGYAMGFFLATIPLLILFGALVGTFFLARDAWRARRGQTEKDPIALLSLVLVAWGAALVGPALEPRVFVRYPPRVEAALPWVAAACAVGVDRLILSTVGKRAAPWASITAAAAMMSIGLVRISTAGASFGLLSGGTRGALAGKIWNVGDGSEIGVVARGIDALRLPKVSLRAPDVPRNYFAVLASTGRMKTQVDIGSSGADLVLTRGPRSGALATADQAGATLWSLSRRR